MVRHPDRLHVLIIAGTVVAGAACRAPDRPPAPDPSTAPAMPERLHRGRLGARPDMRLVPCGEDVEIALEDRTGGALAGARAELGDDAGSLFVEVRGTRIGGGLVARGLVRAFPAGEGPWCDSALAPGELRAHGNEPFWSLTIRPDGVEWMDPERGTIILPPALASTVTQGHRFTSEIPGMPGRLLVVTVTPGDCRDGMSGAWFPLDAEVLFEGLAMRGCAYEGG